MKEQMEVTLAEYNKFTKNQSERLNALSKSVDEGLDLFDFLSCSDFFFSPFFLIKNGVILKEL